MTDAERLMNDDVRSGEASAEVHCLACEHTFLAALWQPRMRCPHCEAIGYPDQAGYNLIPLTWVCPHCEHSNDGMTNFCVNCGEGQASRCLRCEADVYGAACKQCGTVQEPIIRRKRLNEKREQRFRPIRAHIISEKARINPTPPPSFNPAYGVAGWRPIDVMPDEEPAAPPPAQKPTPQRAKPKPPAKPQRRKGWLGNLIGRVFFGLLCIGAGAYFILSEQMNVDPQLLLNEAVLWFDQNLATQLQGGTNGPSIIWPIIVGIAFLMVFSLFIVRFFVFISRQLIK